MGMIRLMAAAAAAILVGLTLAAPAHAACDDRYLSTCMAAPPAEAADRSQARPVKPGKPLNLRAVKRASPLATTRTVERRRHYRSVRKYASRRALFARTRVQSAPVLAAAAEKPVTDVKVNPPLPPAAETVAAAPASPGPSTPPVVAESQDEANEIDLAADTTADTATPPASVPVASQGEVNMIDLAAAAPSDPADDNSWLRQIVVVLGGALTIASAVRLLIG